MNTRKVLAIGLDGYEQSLGNKLIEAGELPALASVAGQSASWLLEHGPAARTGLAWEHFSSGMSPEMANRWSACYFNKNTYEIRQQGTTLKPFISGFKSKSVIFDPCYFDLGKTSSASGIVNWGAHDPGISNKTIPEDLLDEILDKFGPYPAQEWLYGVCWQSTEQTETMGRKLVQALETRTGIAKWLLKDRFPDWNLGLVVTGELHSANEAFWYGIDPDHPLHGIPSAKAAGNGLINVYKATDKFVGELINTFPDTTILVFSMGGMGINNSDVPSMVLLPELLYRMSFKKPFIRKHPQWDEINNGVLCLESGETWSAAIRKLFPEKTGKNKQKNLKQIPDILARKFKKNFSRTMDPDLYKRNLDWMPATFYADSWKHMRAFAIPAYYDGQIRVNLAGRERYGKVTLQDYTNFLDDLEATILACTDRNGECVVKEFDRRPVNNALHRHPSDADLKIVWQGSPLEFNHPEFGKIGPIPFRRTGGHTGPYGILHIINSGIAAGKYGIRSAYDVAPTIIDLLGEHRPEKLCGNSLLSVIQSRAIA